MAWTLDCEGQRGARREESKEPASKERRKRDLLREELRWELRAGTYLLL